MKSSTYKVGRNTLCPCGSEKKFKHCCEGKSIQWSIDEEGNVSRMIPRSKEINSIVEGQRKNFQKHFERDISDDDPLFLMKYLYSENDTTRIITEAMEETGLDPAFIHAYRKTGYLISNDNLNVATGAAIQEWEEAVEEFDLFEGEPEEGTEGFFFDQLISQLLAEIESLIYLFGLTSDKFLNTPLLPEPKGLDSILSASQYQALCIARSHRTLRSIRILLNERIADDVLKLARTIFENYLHIIFVGKHPEKVHDLVDAVVGLRNGTYQYKQTKNQKEDKRIIVDMKTGLEYAGHISVYQMAQSSDIDGDLDFFDFFYRTTSEFLHPSVFSLDSYISDGELDPIKSHMHEEGVIFSIAVALMVADHIPLIQGCPTSVIKDVETVSKRIRGKLLQALELLDIWQKRIGADKEEIELLKHRFKV